MNSEGVLLVFAKSPEAGKVKTRLIPYIGVDAATTLYKKLLTRTLITSARCCFTKKQLWLSGDTEHSYFKELNEIDSFKKVQQCGNNLGDRMFNAFEITLSEFDYAVLIGTDCPSLTSNDLKSAANMLESNKDVVLGPAEDGGYYLIGLKKNNIDLFSNIEWGTETVFSKTVSIAESLGLNVGVLTVRNDIDRIEDLKLFDEIKNNDSI